MTLRQHIAIQEVPPSNLVANPWNTNHVSPENEAKVRGSLKEFGFFKPIIAREVPGNKLQILGGEHRWKAAVADRMITVPVINLGPISDERAKQISLIDNGRYGIDDATALANLLEELSATTDITKFMPYTEQELQSIFSSVEIDLDNLGLDEADDRPPPKIEQAVQSHQILRFKVPVADAQKVSETIEAIMKAQKFDKEDSLTNAGNALVWLVTEGVK